MNNPHSEVGPAGRDLLARLVFREPDPCYLVAAGRGREALVVTTMMGTLEPARRYNRATLQDLAELGLVTYGETRELTPYERWGKKPQSGYPVTLTEAGRRLVDPA